MKKIIKLSVTTIFCNLILMCSIYAAPSVTFSAGSGTVNVGQNKTIAVSVNVSEAYNAVDITVNLTNFTYVSGSASSNWILVGSPYTVSGSQIKFAGATTGSFTGSKTVLTLTVKASTVGTAKINISGTIAVSSNNQEYSGSGVGTYTVQAAPTAMPTSTPTPTPPPVAGNVSVSSSTHPDQNIWYQSKNPAFTWIKSTDMTEFSYILDKEISTVPDDISEGETTNHTYQNISDGTSYFHIKAKNNIGWGNTTHYKINIDSVQPQPFTPTIVKDQNTGDILLYFSTYDNSGITKYLVFQDGKLLGAQSSGVKIDNVVNNITVQAIDAAGNIAESKIDLKNAIISTNNSTNNTNNIFNPSTNVLQIIISVLAFIVFVYACIISVLYFKNKIKPQKK